MERVLTISYVEPDNGDYPCLTVFFADEKMAVVKNVVYGIEAMMLYCKLTSPLREVKSNMYEQRNAHWIANAFKSWPFQNPPGVETFVLSKEQVEEILKEPIRQGQGELLHNQNCPYDYKCRAVDCIECMEIYGKTGGGEC